MRVVAIDSASRLTAWVVATDGAGTVAERREVRGGHLDRGLPIALREMLRVRPDAVVVLTGPGSYNGVRAGMAAALGLASALAIPLHGLGSLAAVAAAVAIAPGEAVTAAADAGRGGVYVAHFVGTSAAAEQGAAVERVDAAALAGRRVLATAAIPGVEVEPVDPVAALGAAVPRALALAPLTAAGLAATHATGR